MSSCRNVTNAPTHQHIVLFLLQEAADWLITNSNTEAGRNFKEFLSRHGHRCIKEVCLALTVRQMHNHHTEARLPARILSLIFLQSENNTKCCVFFF